MKQFARLAEAQEYAAAMEDDIRRDATAILVRSFVS